MVFSSLVFLSLFLPVTLLGYYLLPKGPRDAWLFLTSLVFYAWGEPVYVLIMLFSTVFDYANGRLIGYFDERGKHKSASLVVMIVSIVVNLGLLCFFKYLGPIWDIPLPIGISFYTFQTLSYTIDVYRGKVGVQKSPIAFGMYVAMFPQLIAGPIVRYSQVEKDIERRLITPQRCAMGMQRFLFGLGKKVLLANPAGEAFSSMNSYLASAPSVLLYWLSALFFTFQIYFDFSGYSDMAIGLGDMLGFSFPENFDHPYESRSITEFWRRWHMTLGEWFREYVYIPLGGNRVSIPRHIFNLFVVWALTGIWHGAGWNFLAWGLYYFVLLVLEKYFIGKVLDRLPAFFSHLYAMLFVVIGWVIFSFDSMADVLSHIRGLFYAPQLAGSTGIYELRQYIPLLILLAVGCTSLPGRIAARLIKSEKVSFAAGALWGIVLFFLSVVMLVGGSYNPFLYFRF